MKRKSLLSFMCLGVVLLFVFQAYPVLAQRPDIQIDLNIGQSFTAGEAIEASVLVSYNPQETPASSLLISEGFQSMDYILEMRVIDPAGRLLLAGRDEPELEVPDAPPLRTVYYNGQFLRVTGCEMIEPGWSMLVSAPDLRQHYDIGIPGYYSVQVQLSAMTFKGEGLGDSCDVNNYQWKGTLKSATRFFYLQGEDARVKVVPDQWSTKWLDPGKPESDIEVQIRPNAGEKTADYQLDSLYLNDVARRRAVALKPMIKAYFPAREVIESLQLKLGTLEAGNWYPVFVKIQKKGDDQVIVESQLIRIVN